MNRYFWPVLLLLSMAGSAQQPATPSPQLSTSDQVALQSLEKSKQDARKQWDTATQEESAILAEWQAGHAGYHLNPQNFAVEADPKPAVKAEAPKEKK